MINQNANNFFFKKYFGYFGMVYEFLSNLIYI